jgi:hypothetical protein
MLYEQFEKDDFLIQCGLIPKQLIKDIYDVYMDCIDKGETREGDSPPMFGTAIELTDEKIFSTTPFKKVESLLRNWLQENMQIRAIPTYNMGRVYTKDTTGMLKHKDRVPCEISVTLPIAYDNAPWQIYIEDREGIDRAVKLHVGDVAFYHGCRANHHRRNNSLNKFHIQHYFHFVDLDSELGSFYNYFRQGNDSKLWKGTLERIIKNNDLPILSDEDKIRYSKLIGEDNV